MFLFVSAAEGGQNGPTDHGSTLYLIYIICEMQERRWERTGARWFIYRFQSRKCLGCYVFIRGRGVGARPAVCSCHFSSSVSWPRLKNHLIQLLMMENLYVKYIWSPWEQKKDQGDLWRVCTDGWISSCLAPWHCLYRVYQKSNLQ